MAIRIIQIKDLQALSQLQLAQQSTQNWLLIFFLRLNITLKITFSISI